MSVVWADGGTYAIVPSWILDADIPDRAVRLFAILATHASADGRHATPSKKKLAGRLRCAVSTLEVSIAALVEAGAISVRERQRGDGSQTSNEYVLHASRTPPPDQPGTPPPDQPGTKELDPVELEETFAAAPQEGSPKWSKAERDLVWDALVKVVGEPKTRSETSDFGRTVSELRAVIPREASAESVLAAMRGRAARWRQRFPDAAFNHRVLRNHWSELSTLAEGRSPEATSDDELEDDGTGRRTF